METLALNKQMKLAKCIESCNGISTITKDNEVYMDETSSVFYQFLGRIPTLQKIFRFLSGG